jgi:hypothetical protein
MKQFRIPPLAFASAAYIMRHGMWLIALTCLPLGSTMASGIEMRKGPPAMHPPSMVGCDPCPACDVVPISVANKLTDGGKRVLASDAWATDCPNDMSTVALPVPFHQTGMALRILYCCWRN